MPLPVFVLRPCLIPACLLPLCKLPTVCLPYCPTSELPTPLCVVGIVFIVCVALLRANIKKYLLFRTSVASVVSDSMVSGSAEYYTGVRSGMLEAAPLELCGLSWPFPREPAPAWWTWMQLWSGRVGEVAAVTSLQGQRRIAGLRRIARKGAGSSSARAAERRETRRTAVEKPIPEPPAHGAEKEALLQSCAVCPEAAPTSLPVPPSEMVSANKIPSHKQVCHAGGSGAPRTPGTAAWKAAGQRVVMGGVGQLGVWGPEMAGQGSGGGITGLQGSTTWPSGGVSHFRDTADPGSSKEVVGADWAGWGATAGRREEGAAYPVQAGDRDFLLGRGCTRPPNPGSSRSSTSHARQMAGTEGAAIPGPASNRV